MVWVAVVLFALPSNAADSERETAVSKTVKMWDLDLARTADVETLYERIQTAAEAVCRSEENRMWNNTRQRVPRGWSERCVDDAVDAARKLLKGPSSPTES